MVGYPYEKRGWKLYDLETQEFFVSRDVVFQEDVFPYLDNTIETVSNDDLPVCHDLGMFHEVSPVEESRGSTDTVVEPSVTTPETPAETTRESQVTT